MAPALGPGTPSRTTDANLNCAFVENPLVSVVPNIGRGPGTPWPPLYDLPGPGEITFIFSIEIQCTTVWSVVYFDSSERVMEKKLHLT